MISIKQTFSFRSPQHSGSMLTLTHYVVSGILALTKSKFLSVQTDFSTQLKEYMQRCRQASDLPLALGFGVKDRTDIDYLTGLADIAVIGTQTIRVVDEQGVDAVGDFIAGLR